MKLGLTKKIVIVTGGTGGIGSQIVTDFLEEEAIVICLVRNLAKFETLKDQINQKKIAADNLYAYECDLNAFQELKEQIGKIHHKFRSIDVLINCAGMTEENPFAILASDTIDKVLDVNLKAPMYLTQIVLRPMFKQKSGCIINISSLSAIKKGRGIVAYASAKAGIETFTRTLANEVGRKNIRVNCVRPGIIQTNMSEALIFRHKEMIESTSSLERFGSPSDVSKAVLFLASDEVSGYITGECLTIDGGMY
jgi:3-oxoacyl-[acyl-carrier protein] reductase